jgi:hypothetical protein
METVATPEFPRPQHIHPRKPAFTLFLTCSPVVQVKSRLEKHLYNFRATDLYG